MGFIARRAQKYKSVDNYLKELWRPLMAWNYAIIVLFDFMLAPIGLGIYTAVTKQPYIQWQPLTIQGGGLFHIAMGAVIGVSAWSRGQEKINGTDAPWDPSKIDNTPIPNYSQPQQQAQGYSQYNNPQPNYKKTVEQQQVVAEDSPQININVDASSTNRTQTGFPRARRFE
mgnify:CR=1 FL=1